MKFQVISLLTRNIDLSLTVIKIDRTYIIKIYAFRFTNDEQTLSGRNSRNQYLEMFFHLPFPHCPLVLVFHFLLANYLSWCQFCSLDLIKKANKKTSLNYAYRVTKKTDIIIPYSKYSTRENDSINFLTHTSFVTRLLNLTQSFEHNDRSRNFTISQEQGLYRNFLFSGYALALRN